MNRIDVGTRSMHKDGEIRLLHDGNLVVQIVKQCSTVRMIEICESNGQWAWLMKWVFQLV